MLLLVWSRPDNEDNADLLCDSIFTAARTPAEHVAAVRSQHEPVLGLVAPEELLAKTGGVIHPFVLDGPAVGGARRHARGGVHGQAAAGDRQHRLIGHVQADAARNVGLASATPEARTRCSHPREFQNEDVLTAKIHESRCSDLRREAATAPCAADDVGVATSALCGDGSDLLVARRPQLLRPTGDAAERIHRRQPRVLMTQIARRSL
mmetsp:Transcript_93782/g.235468  ORF Transcript_93782/g.235468 Transcript_93782/m.235468 type:complete len:208 (-) Transcript_93782:1322-1945(-)